LGKVSIQGTAEVNGRPMPAGATVFSGDRIATRNQASASVALAGGHHVVLPELSAAQLDRTGQQVRVALERGALAVVSRASESVVVHANGLRVQPAGKRGGIYQVAVEKNAVVVFSRQGDAEVHASDRSYLVPAGKVLRFELAENPQGPAGAGASHALSPGVKAAIVLAVLGGIAAAIAIPLALLGDEAASPSSR